MNVRDKVQLLGSASKYDVCSTASKKLGKTNIPGICTSWGPDGRCISLYKVLQTNVCTNDCRFCVNRSSSKCKRAIFKPEELKETFLHLFYGNYIDGLFLSSGIYRGPDETMEMMVETVELIRKEFKGYIHMKIIPGSEYHLVKRACELADRVSINLEAPNKESLQILSDEKHLRQDILRRSAWAKNLIRKGLAQSGQTTQFVVGPGGESDYDLVKMSRWMYEKMELRRSYFSAFQPVGDTPFSNLSRTPLLREHRLYQMDWLLRVYKFDLRDMKRVFDENGNLPLDMDPKYLYAKEKGILVDPGDATKQELLSVPGIGPISANRIITMRKFGSITHEKLKRAGVVVKRALPFLRLEGRQTLLNDFKQENKSASLPPKSPVAAKVRE